MHNLIVPIVYLLFCLSNVHAQVVAFPSAEGGGMYTSGGRGGEVYYVNTLEDNQKGDFKTKEGSLRWCLSQKGSKTILFKIAGTIWLNSKLQIDIGDLTIAGQSAPGDGICIAGYPVSLRADNVIIRYLRFRMGDLLINAEEADGADAFSGGKNQDIIIDHCSISWSTDECSSFYDNKNFTMQWCIISESLRLSGHSKGAHGYGAIWGGVQATFHHNLLAHHDSRTPRLGPGAKYAGHDTTDMRNNIIYNWNGNGAYGGEAMHVNIVNNYYKAGPATEKRIQNRIVALNAKTESRPFPSIKDVWGKYYIHGNFLPHNEMVSADNWLGVSIVGEQDVHKIKLQKQVVVRGQIFTHDVRTAYEKVLAYAGSSLRRDDVDQRIVLETETGTAQFAGRSPYNGKGGQWKSINYPRKGLLDSQQDLNPRPDDKSWSAWPELKSESSMITDNDLDGIPDGWLENHYPNKTSKELNQAGHTYLEVYLNGLIEHISKKQR